MAGSYDLEIEPGTDWFVICGDPGGDEEAQAALRLLIDRNLVLPVPHPLEMRWAPAATERLRRNLTTLGLLDGGMGGLL